MDSPTVAFTWFVLAAQGALACGGSIPDPAPVAARFAEASRRGDHQAVYQMLSKESQRSLGKDRVKQLLTEQQHELTENANQLTAAKARQQVTVQVRFVDGDSAVLALEQGELRVDSAAAFPSHAVTPQQALLELRAALQRRSYPALMGVLTRNSAAEFDAHLSSLVQALADAQTLDIEINDNRAVVTLPQGHKVELWREGGLWKVHDFE